MNVVQKLDEKELVSTFLRKLEEIVTKSLIRRLQITEDENLTLTTCCG